jgi:hypothetical protein
VGYRRHRLSVGVTAGVVSRPGPNISDRVSVPLRGRNRKFGVSHVVWYWDHDRRFKTRDGI